MSHPIRIERQLKSLSSEAFVKKLQAYAKRRKFTLSGDEARGEFGARGIEGNYKIENKSASEVLVIEITRKPMLVPSSILISKAEERLAAWDTV